MPVTCLEDNTLHENTEALHLHLRKLKVTQEKYYVKHYAKKDLFTGDPIPFKNVDQYLATDFNDKRNLKKWVAANPVAGKTWCINWLKKRIDDKDLVIAPTQAELATLSGPTMHYFESIGGYNKICNELGLKSRFSQPELVFTPLATDTKIVVDTREQKPLNITFPRVFQALEAGDYGLYGDADKQVYIERKSRADFMSTLSRDYNRFCREIERAKESGSYVVVLVESSIADIVKMDYLRKSIPHLQGSRVTSAHVFKNMREMLHKYTNFQVLFVDDRKKAAKALVKIFELGKTVIEIDLQFSVEADKINLE